MLFVSLWEGTWHTYHGLSAAGLSTPCAVGTFQAPSGLPPFPTQLWAVMKGPKNSLVVPSRTAGSLSPCFRPALTGSCCGASSSSVVILRPPRRRRATVQCLVKRSDTASPTINVPYHQPAAKPEVYTASHPPYARRNGPALGLYSADVNARLPVRVAFVVRTGDLSQGSGRAASLRLVPSANP